MSSRNTTRTPVRILFVEDSEVDVELAVLELERDGFDVTWDRVDMEEDLRRHLVSNGPQVVVSDYSMPVFDGLTALRVVRELRPELPFIFMSGTIGEERAIESIRSGATDYVLKGNIRRLATAVRRALAEAADRAQAQAAEQARARLAAILEATSDFVLICDAEGRLIYSNQAASRLILPEDDTGERTITRLHPEWAREIIEGKALPTAAEQGIWQGECAVLSADGNEIPVSQVIIGHRGTGGGIEYYSAIARDISERKAYEARIQYLANFDALTNLPNRALLADRAAQATALGRRTDRSIALLVVDIDRFKLINDAYGPAVGDLLLRTTGERLRGAVREGDTVARLGADAFAVLATELAHPDDVVNVVRKLQGAMRTACVIEGKELHVTVSVGAGLYPRDGADFETLLRNAEAAMHRAKAQGQDGFQFYAADMTREAAERLEIESALRAALIRKELELHYQPQVRLADRKIVGVEALMRWKHPTRGWISPAQFIPIAEHSDLILGLGDWALATACRQIQSWSGKAHDLRLAVNVSARQFLSSGFTDAVARVLASTGMDPSRLELEITEGVLVDDRDEAVAVIERLNALGVQIAVDDFGTGYSSLSYLSRLPIDCLKIDRSFVMRSSEDRHDAAIAQAIISLGSSLALRVLAEGVETEQQYRFLVEHGCEEAQGYMFAKPLPAEALEKFVNER